MVRQDRQIKTRRIFLISVIDLNFEIRVSKFKNQEVFI